MKIFLDCIPCMLRQTLEAAYMVTEDDVIQAHIIDEALEVLSGYRSFNTAPELCEALHSIVKKHSGIEDPYANVKLKDISEAKKLESIIEDFYHRGSDQLLRALKISATGNIMDSAIFNNLDIKTCVVEELEKPFAICHEEELKRDLDGAKTILIIGDNAGEVVFDTVLAKHLSRDYKIIYAVRAQPIINDATIEDALSTEISNYAEVISSGCETPGTVMKLCNENFQEIFVKADVVISKGQGNFEALSDVKRSLYFLLKAKCHKIAKALDVEINEYVLKRN